MDDSAGAVRAIEVIGVIFILFLIVKYGVLAAMKDRKPQQHTPESQQPARYRVIGVDLKSKMDTEWYCTATSPENAKVKGELEGIIVTRVERVT
jgi:hypothetical protein